MRNASTPVRPDAQDAAAQNHQTPQQALRPNRLFDTPLLSATPQQSSAARPNTHATPEAGPAAVEGGRTAAAAAGVKVRKLTFDAAAPSAAAQKAPKAEPPKAEQPKARGGIKFELGESAMAVSLCLGQDALLDLLAAAQVLPCWAAAIRARQVYCVVWWTADVALMVQPTHALNCLGCLLYACSC